jgi:hypothetical protein
MNKKTALIILGIAVYFSGCVTGRLPAVSLPPQPSDLTITKVSVNKKTFNPKKDKTVIIEFELSVPTNKVIINLYDETKTLIQTLTRENQPSGKIKIPWNGKTASGSFFDRDLIIYTITAQTQNKIEIYDPSHETAGIELTPRGLYYDKDVGEINYILPRAARVRLRAGLKEGPLLFTMLDWQAQEAGSHKINWDGWDSQHNINLYKCEHPDINLTSYSLPDNSIIISQAPRVNSKPNSSAPKPKNQFVDNTKQFHYHHNPGECHEPKFSLSFPTSTLNQNKIPVTKSGRIPITMEISPQNKQSLINKRFELMFFVDTIFTFEEEEGTSPFTFYWNTATLLPGEHLITVNLMSYDDHIGSQTQKIIIEDTGTIDTKNMK